jgi:hypothetical protein
VVDEESIFRLGQPFGLARIPIKNGTIFIAPFFGKNRRERIKSLSLLYKIFGRADLTVKSVPVSQN